MPQINVQREAPYERFMAYAQAHHDGDVDAAIDELLFCHKYMTSMMRKRAEEDLKLNGPPAGHHD